MQILICSYDFFPRIGGTESAGLVLANGLAGRGYQVSVVTATPGSTDDDLRFPFRVVRRPALAELRRMIRDADIVWHNQVSLRLLWPVLLTPRPLVFVHHSPLATDTGSGPRFGILKRAACMLGQNAFVSRAYRDAAGLPGPVILNSYDETTFRVSADVARDRDVAFLGRLVPEKGADILIDAVSLLARQGTRVTATVIGAGPQEHALRAQTATLAVDDRIEFTGPLRGETLARTLGRHRLLAMPSRWFEGLPIAAIEAIACGCVVVGADSGGLPEAVGPCGPILARNDAATLASTIATLVGEPTALARYRDSRGAHLAKFTKSALLDSCETIIRDTIKAFATERFHRLRWLRQIVVAARGRQPPARTNEA